METTPKDFEAVAKEIFERVNDSYIVWNKGAKNGINHNTKLTIQSLIVHALRTATEERGHRVVRQMEIIDKLTQETFGYKKRIKELEKALLEIKNVAEARAKAPMSYTSGSFGSDNKVYLRISEEALNKGARDEKTT